MWVWLANTGNGIKSLFSIISRVMKLENRVTALEDKIKTMHVPPKDIREGLIHNGTLNVYENKSTGEKFCPTCLGNGKRVSVQIKDNYGNKYWNCYDCKSSGDDGREPNYPRQANNNYDPFG